MKHFGSFSDAIRYGAQLRPQAFNYLLLDGATCAVGAGLEAMGHEAEEGTVVGGCAVLNRDFPYLISVFAQCPVSQGCGDPPRSLLYAVMDLNDRHHWTREQIADWLQGEEDKLGYVTISEPEQSHEPAHEPAFATARS